ncbi:hypothetical protein ACKVMT_02795 [Halobacteriales archaeon Cl-PHB]
MTYTFVATGPVDRVRDGSDGEAEDNDKIVDQGDGTFHVEGVTGSGYGDTFAVAGSVETFQTNVAREHVTLLSDGDDVTEDLWEGARRFSVLTNADAPRMTYEFTVDGPVSRVTDGSKNEAETNNDEIDELADGSYRVSGVTGSGYGDAFRIQGSVTSFSTTATSQYVVLELDGEDVTTEYLDESYRFAVLTTEEAPRTTYEFTATGPVSRVTDGSKNEAETNNDTIEEQAEGTFVVTGVTGSGYGDTFIVQGEVTSFSADPPPNHVRLERDGEDVTGEYLE